MTKQANQRIFKERQNYMKHYLVIFDSQAHDMVSDGSDYFLTKSIIEADSPKNAVKSLIDKMIKENDFEDKDEIRDFIEDVKSDGISVIELASPKVTRID